MRNRLAIRYSVEGDLRFISHHDSLRLFERALLRADLPLRYSEGFNQRPRISIALPRPVGVASRDELLVIALVEPVDPSTVVTRLTPQMPQGLALLDAEPVDDDDRRLPCEATYSLSIDRDAAGRLAEKAGDIRASPTLVVEGAVPGKGSQCKSVDIRPYLQLIEVKGDTLRWTQTVTGTGTARVGEVLDALGLPSGEHLHRLTREGVKYER